MNTAIEIELLSGSAITAQLREIAALRIAVFQEWPYLYAGTPESELRYLKHYAACADSLVALARVGGRIVGASTALPLSAAGGEFQAPFIGSDFAIDSIFYLGESVLLPKHRGCGIGHAFFDVREAQARQRGARYTAFCAVDRAPEDPRRPDGYRELGPFWAKRGYSEQTQYKANLNWSECGDTLESTHSLTFWLKELTDADHSHETFASHLLSRPRYPAGARLRQHAQPAHSAATGEI